MSDTTVDENYKGIFQEYCYARNLDPVYESTPHGCQSEPSWNVTVRYGQSVYTTPNPVRGSKRFAEQVAARQLLEQIESRQEAFLAGEPFDQLPDSEEAHAPQGSESDSEILVTPPLETLHVPVELVTTALEIANNRLAESGTRFRQSSDVERSNRIFAQDLANLTMIVVREVAKTEDDDSPPV
jgi:hypothetical protein